MCDVAPAIVPGDFANLVFAEWLPYRAVRTHTLGRLAHQLQRDERFRLFPEKNGTEATRHGLARDLKNIAEATRDDETELIDAL